VRLLFITSHRIGDAVLSSGVLAQAIDAHRGAQVTVACGPLSIPLFADAPGLVELHPMARRAGAGHWVDLWRAVVGRRWDLVIDLRGSAFAWTVWSRRRLVCRAEKRREHRVEELARLLRLPALPAPRLWVSPERTARAARRLSGRPPVLAVGPTANWGAKQWPAERFAEAIIRLTAADGPLPGAHIAIFGGAGERATAQPVLDAVPAARRIDLVGEPDLLDVFALLGRCALYLGNDSGLMHMAAAAGIPTLGLFGPSPDWRYGPWGQRTAVVRTPESFEELVSENPAFDHRRQDSLMTSLTVEAVTEAARSLLARTWA
jgi:ADP-heptose:LPS heptosyltransferase